MEKNKNIKRGEDYDEKCIFCHWETQDVIFEDEKIVVFNDKYPMSRFHILVIPKDHIKNVNSLSNKHLDLLNYMKKNAIEYMLKKSNDIKESDMIFGFHVTPFNSIEHLHLHCIVPPYKNYYYYFVNTYVMFLSLDDCIENIKNNKYHWKIQNLLFSKKKDN